MMTKNKKAHEDNEREDDFLTLPIFSPHHRSIVTAVNAAVERGKIFTPEEDEVVLDKKEVLQTLVGEALGAVAQELDLWEKVDLRLRDLVKKHPYLVEQLAEPNDIEDQLELTERMRGWLGDPHFLQDYQAAIMAGNGWATIPRRQLPGEDFIRVDRICGKRGYTPGTAPPEGE